MEQDNHGRTLWPWHHNIFKILPRIGKHRGYGISESLLAFCCETAASACQFRQFVIAIFNTNWLDKTMTYPWDIFQHGGRWMPISEMHMNLPHISNMRHYRQPVAVCSMCDLYVFSY